MAVRDVSEFNHLVEQLVGPLRSASLEDLQRCHLQMQIVLAQARIETLDRGKPDADTVKAAEMLIICAGERLDGQNSLE